MLRTEFKGVFAFTVIEQAGLLGWGSTGTSTAIITNYES